MAKLPILPTFLLLPRAFLPILPILPFFAGRSSRFAA
jgi:hypothetical protein